MQRPSSKGSLELGLSVFFRFLPFLVTVLFWFSSSSNWVVFSSLLFPFQRRKKRTMRTMLERTLVFTGPVPAKGQRQPPSINLFRPKFRVSPSTVGRAIGKTDGPWSGAIPETNRESQQYSGTALGRLRVRLAERLGKPMGLFSEPFLKTNRESQQYSGTALQIWCFVRYFLCSFCKHKCPTEVCSLLGVSLGNGSFGEIFFTSLGRGAFLQILDSWQGLQAFPSRVCAAVSLCSGDERQRKRWEV